MPLSQLAYLPWRLVGFGFIARMQGRCGLEATASARLAASWRRPRLPPSPSLLQLSQPEGDTVGLYENFKIDHFCNSQIQSAESLPLTATVTATSGQVRCDGEGAVGMGYRVQRRFRCSLTAAGATTCTPVRSGQKNDWMNVWAVIVC